MSQPVLMQCRKTRRDPEVDLNDHRREPPKRDEYGKVRPKGWKPAPKK